MADELTWGSIASWLWSQRKEVAQSLQDLYSWFRGAGRGKDGGRGIVILGAGGTDKSTLGRMLAGEYDPLFDAVEPYRESIGIEEYSLQDDPTVQIAVPPGQSQRRDATWDELLAALSRGEYRGVIVVSAFGYHSLGEIWVEQTTMAPPIVSSTALTSQHPPIQLDAYLATRQADELRVLDRVLPNLGRSGNRTWLVSAVTKRDLWWPRRREVEYYYQEGAYGRKLSEWAATVNQRSVRHEIVFLSLTISRFLTAQGQHLLDNAAGYDHPLHFESHRRLFETLAALREWENSA